MVAAILGFFIYGYTGAVLGVLALLWFLGDRWWFATILLYGPRWIYAFPMIIFVPVAVLWQRRWLWPLELSTLIIVWPIMGLNLPWSGWDDSTRPSAFRVLTYNIQRWSVSGEEFSALLDSVNPDFAAVQDTGVCTESLEHSTPMVCQASGNLHSGVALPDYSI